MVSERGSVFRLLQWQWRSVTVFTVSGLLATIAHKMFEVSWLVLPTTPVVVVGGALGIFVSFRTNSAYDRWWEGRKLWGRLINASRQFSNQVCAYLPESLRDERRKLVRRHMAYVHVLRCLLRRHDAKKDPDVRNLLAEEDRELLTQTNPTHGLLARQAEHLSSLTADGFLHEIRLQSMDRVLHELLDVQGGCERIKNTPMPRGYGFIAHRLVVAFGLLFPFVVVESLGWATVPMNVLVCLSFGLISEAGRVLEDPFTMFYNGLPLTALSKTIEANLTERLGERPVPEIPKPTERGILM